MSLTDFCAELWQAVAVRLPTAHVAALAATCTQARDGTACTLQRRMWEAHWRSLLSPPCPEHVADIVWHLCGSGVCNEVLIACLGVADAPLCGALCTRHNWCLKTLDQFFVHHGTALNWAAQNGHLPMVQLLASHFGLTADDVRVHDNFALRFAAAGGHLPVVQFLASHFGLSADDARAYDNFALRLAAKGGHVPVLHFLASHFGLTSQDGRALENGALRWAAGEGHLPALQFLVSHFGLTAEDARTDDNCALWWACQDGHLPVVQFLASRFGLTARDARGTLGDNVPLQRAVTFGHLPVVQFLFSHFGLTPDDVNPRALHYAFANGHHHVLAFLKKSCGVGAACVCGPPALVQ